MIFFSLLSHCKSFFLLLMSAHFVPVVYPISFRSKMSHTPETVVDLGLNWRFRTSKLLSAETFNRSLGASEKERGEKKTVKLHATAKKLMKSWTTNKFESSVGSKIDEGRAAESGREILSECVHLVVIVESGIARSWFASPWNIIQRSLICIHNGFIKFDISLAWETRFWVTSQSFCWEKAAVSSFKARSQHIPHRSIRRKSANVKAVHSLESSRG